MKRDEFLTTFSISFAAVCAGGCLAGCGKSDTTPTPAPGGGGNTLPPPAPANFTADLTSEILNVGDAKASGGILLVRISAGNVASSFTAVQQACTHEGFSVNYLKNQGQFFCPNHGSTFSNSGAVIVGPATVNLKQYAIAVTGTTLTVS